MFVKSGLSLKVFNTKSYHFVRYPQLLDQKPTGASRMDTNTNSHKQYDPGLEY